MSGAGTEPKDPGDDALDAAGPPQEGAPRREGKVSRDAVTWAFRLLIGREPANLAEVDRHLRLPDIGRLRTTFAGTWEFQDFADRSTGNGKAAYRLPMFLLRPPQDPAVPFRFAPPDLETPVSQLCTLAQFTDPALLEIAEAMGMPTDQSRRLWESCYAVSALATHGAIAPGKRAIGFAVGRNRITALLASRGVEVLATDRAEPMVATAHTLQDHLRHRLLGLLHPDVVHLEEFERLTAFQEIDPAEVPTSLHGQFDACWSLAAVPTAGSLDKALAFLRGSLDVLRPGGVSVHVFDLNIGSNEATVNSERLVALRRIDLERLALALQQEGHRMEPLNFHPGDLPEDEDLAFGKGTRPWPKRRHGAHLLSPFGLTLHKAG
jgi:hypothetical protein